MTDKDFEEYKNSPLVPLDLDDDEDFSGNEIIPIPEDDYTSRICPKCGEEYGEDYKYTFCRKDGGKLFMLWECRHCGANFSKVQGYTAINVCPNCGKKLDPKQKEAINKGRSSETNILKRICTQCKEIFDEEFECCGMCGNTTIPMQCACGENFRQKEDGGFDKYCPVCGKPNPTEAALKKKKEEQERIRKQQEEERKQAEARRIAEEKRKKEEKERNNLKAVDIIKFGSYPYEADGTEKPIEWIILEKYSDGTALLLSKYGLDAVRFDKKSSNWETSEIRQWLNYEFYKRAFKKADKSLILETRLEQTRDKMFLLSIGEAEKYFSNDRDRICLPTPYAKTNKTKTGSPVYTNANYGGSCWWWLRSPGDRQYFAAYVTRGGIVRFYGSPVINAHGAVRVAFKINLKNL